MRGCRLQNSTFENFDFYPKLPVDNIFEVNFLHRLVFQLISSCVQKASEYCDRYSIGNLVQHFKVLIQKVKTLLTSLLILFIKF